MERSRARISWAPGNGKDSPLGVLGAALDWGRWALKRESAADLVFQVRDRGSVKCFGAATCKLAKYLPVRQESPRGVDW